MFSERFVSVSFFNYTAVPEWSVDDVCLWLEALLLGSCTDSFRKKGLCGRSLLDLQIDDMVVS